MDRLPEPPHRLACVAQGFTQAASTERWLGAMLGELY
jgi:hypothetical protein